MTTSVDRADMQMDLPPVYYEGQTLELSMQSTPGRASAWFMNGEFIAEGVEQNALSYTFKALGEYVLDYIETEQHSGAAVVVARARAYTRVVSMPKVVVEVAVNIETDFLPPAGYHNHVWHLDGQKISTDAVLRHSFKNPGVHTVECMASSPEEGTSPGFRRVHYITTVK